MLEKFINIELIRSPVNWAIVFLMVSLATSLLIYLDQSRASANQEN